MLQCIAGWYSVLQRVAMCFTVVQTLQQNLSHSLAAEIYVWYNMLQCVAVCCSVLQCVAV